MMSPFFSAAWIEGEFAGGENVLPAPGAFGTGVLPAEAEREVDATLASLEVALVQGVHSFEMVLEGPPEAFGEDGDPLAEAFPVADDDMAVAEIDIFDAETDAFHEPEPGSVEEFGQKAVVAFHLVEDGVGFGGSKDDRDFRRSRNALDFADKVEFSVEKLLIKEEKGAESLILGGRGDVAFNGEVGEEGGDFFFAHVGRMPFSVEEDVSANPIHVGLLGADAVVLDAEAPADAVE